MHNWGLSRLGIALIAAFGILSILMYLAGGSQMYRYFPLAIAIAVLLSLPGMKKSLGKRASG